MTPAHDTNDYELGRRHNLPVINIMAPDASISDKHGWTDIGDAHLFVGMTREAARKKVVQEFKGRTVGGYPLLAEMKPYRHSVGHSYRSHAAIEPYLSDQWYVKVTDERLAGAANRAMVEDQREGTKASGHQGIKGSGDGGLRFYPDRYAKIYEAWHENIRDWCISRQLWWGHRIPVWSRRQGTRDLPAHLWQALVANTGVSNRFVSFSDQTTEVQFCSDDPDTLWLACVFDPDHRFEPHVPSFAGQRLGDVLEAHGFVQDPDVLDTWFSSALWPMSTLGWPEPPAEMNGLLEAFNPSNVLCTAREIITLWVSRMVMFNRYLLGEGQGKGPLPFTDVFIHSVIQDGEGRKMSKSLGNGVNPLDIIISHGADAMRFILCKMTTNTQDVRMPVVFDKEKNCNTSPKFDEGRNFVTKVFNAAKFVLMNLEQGAAAASPGKPSRLADRWILSRLARVTARVEAAIAAYDYADYAEALYQFLWWDFCDWYLEAIKPTVKTDPAQQGVVKTVLECAVRLLHPICPFVTEVLHGALRECRTSTPAGIDMGAGAEQLCITSWPRIGASLIDEAAEKQFAHLQQITEAIRQVRASQGVEPRRKITLHTDAALIERIKAGGGIVETSAGLETVVLASASDAGPRTTFTFEGREHALSNLKDAADPLVERKTLQEQIDKLQKAIAVLEGRLANPGYAERAPPKMVQETKDQLAQKSAERDAATRRLAEIG